MLYARFTSAFTCAALTLVALAAGAVLTREDFTLEPAVEAAWQVALKEARSLRVTRDQKRLAEQVEAHKEKYQLGEEAVQRLEAAIPATVEEAVEHWEAFISHVRRPLLRGPAEKGLKALQSLEKSPADFLSRYVVPYYHRPEELAPWTGALKQALPQKDWQALEAERKKKNQQRHDKARQLVAAGMKKQDPVGVYRRAFDSFWLELEAVMPKPGPVLKELKSPVDAWAADYAKKCERESVLRMDSFNQEQSSWKDAVKRGYFVYWVGRAAEVEARKKQLLAKLPPAVRDGHAALLARWAEREREAVIAARVVVVEMAVPLTDRQRAEVEAVAKTLPLAPVGEQPYPSDSQVWKDWQGEALKKLTGILDDSQERLWAQRVKSWESNSYQEPEMPAPGPPRHPGAGPADQAEVEAVVSEYLAEGSRLDVAKALPTVMRRVEEVVRVLNLGETARSELELLAKGTLQAKAVGQRVSASSYVRSQSQGATAANIRQRLVGLGRISFSSRSNEKSLLEKDIEDRLTAEQKETLLAHEQAAQQRQEQCIIGLILARLERLLVLGAQQGKAVEQQLTEVMATYGPDIARTFQSFGERAPWFLQSYYQMVPCFGVEEAALKKLLNARQQATWNEQTGRWGSHYWEQTQRHHEVRKQAKPNIDFEGIIIEP